LQRAIHDPEGEEEELEPKDAALAEVVEEDAAMAAITTDSIPVIRIEVIVMTVQLMGVNSRVVDIHAVQVTCPRAAWEVVVVVCQGMEVV
jgi:hypothetical protein